jgi:hypothetical protein
MTACTAVVLVAIVLLQGVMLLVLLLRKFEVLT